MLTFDCYGTLIDWESGMFQALQPLVSRLGRPLSRDECSPRMRATNPPSRSRPRPSATASSSPSSTSASPRNGACRRRWDECIAYGKSIRDWPAFADSADALRYLKQHYKLVILSNVDNESFAFSNRKLGVEFDAIFTAEDIGSYKPSPRNFEYMLEKLDARGIGKGDILHTAESLFHDHAPANDFGLASCWIHRRHATGGFGATMNPGAMPSTDFRFTSMAELAKAHRRRACG